MSKYEHRSTQWGKCEKCGTDTYVEVHHVIPRSEGGEDGPTINVCMECHILIHSEAGQFKGWGWFGGKVTWARHADTSKQNLAKGPRARWDRHKQKSTIAENLTD